jgi:CBS-domain-containing membrane protein
VFGVFIWTGATASLRHATFERRIPALQAASLARRAVPAAANDSLALANQRMADAQAGAIVVLDASGQPAGVVNEAAAAATPPERRPWVPVSSLATPLPRQADVAVDAAGHDLIAALQRAGSPAVLVRDRLGAVYGVLFVDDVERALG